MKEKDIAYENADHSAWVLDHPKGYHVMIAGITVSHCDSNYPHDADGLSIAIARCDYIATRNKTKGKA